MSRQFPAFRGLAILLVVLNHAVTLSLQAVATDALPGPMPAVRWILEAVRMLGVIAVPIFLFLSGGYIAYALQAGRLGQAYLTVVLGLRFILVPYLLWSLVFYGLLVVLNGARFTLPEVVKNLLVGYPYNFIPLLVFYYILAPLLMPVARRFPWVLLLAIAAYQLFSIAALQSGELGFTLPEWASRFTLPALRLTIALWGIFFPLGLVYGLHSAHLTPQLSRWRPLLLAGAIGAYVFALLYELALVRFPLAELLCPVFVVLSMPVIARESIPFARSLERLGMRAYGIYLTNLILLSLAVEAILAWAPGLLQRLLLAVPLLVAGVIVAQAGLQSTIRRAVGRQGLRWVFG